MTHLINKSAIVAEIEKTYKFHEKRGNEHDSSICDVLYGLLHRIDTLEVKEVDLNKEIGEYMSTYWPKEKELHPFLGYTAKYFFKLGMLVSNKTQKGDK